MRRSFNSEELDALSKVKFLAGSVEIVEQMMNTPTTIPFDNGMMEFINIVSGVLMQNREAKAYPDVVTLGFWLRKANLSRLKEKYGFKDENVHLGRGIVFHIAPSNVPVNFAYSLFSGLLMGNCNIVRVPSKEFPQVGIILGAIEIALEQNEAMRPYIVLVRYGRKKEINDIFSTISDVRIIWGGDQSVMEIRKSPMLPRGTEVTFADRYSLTVIDTDTYISIEDKRRVALDFYNDTYLSDQNACTSPRLVVWTGKWKKEAKKLFWNELYELVRQRYEFQPIMAVNKLTSFYFMAVKQEKIYIEDMPDNRIIRVNLQKVTADIMDCRETSGFFFEYETNDLCDLTDLCNDNRVQTIGIIGDNKMLRPLVMSGLKGIDRIVPIGHTMDFDLLWDGYDLRERLTRTIKI